jgi:hypothetical protein
VRPGGSHLRTLIVPSLLHARPGSEPESRVRGGGGDRGRNAVSRPRPVLLSTAARFPGYCILLGAALVIALLGSCTDDRDEVTRVEPPAIWRVVAAPMLSLEGTSGEEQTNFHDVSQVAVMANGSILVVNRGTSEVMMLDSSGALVRSFGGVGDGPGEYRRIAGVAPAGPDGLFIFDSALSRVTLVSTEGRVIATHRLPPPDRDEPSPVYRLAGVFGDDGLVLIPDAYPAFSRDTGIYEVTGRILLFSLGEQALRAFGPPMRLEMVGDGRLVTRRPLGNMTVAAVHDDRLYVGEPAHSLITGYDSDGAAVGEVRPMSPGRRVTSSMVDSVVDSYSRTAHEPRAVRRWYRQWDFPDSMPAFSRLLFDDGGNLWVQEYQFGDPAPLRWSVFDPAGAWLAAVETPSRFTLHGVRGDAVYGKFVDDLGIEYIQMHELER